LLTHIIEHILEVSEAVDDKHIEQV